MMFSRREILKSASAGFGYLAFASMANAESAKSNPLAPSPPHFPGTAKRVVFVCMSGGPSHVDTYDYKPQLIRDHGKTGRYGGKLLSSPWKFRQRGQSGLWISDLFPNVGERADDLCLIRSMQCDQPAHPSAMTQMHTGTARFIRPSLGAWTLYGLGTENESIPGFISLNPLSGNSRNYGSAFLPSIYGGTKVGRSGHGSNESVRDLSNQMLSRQQQRAQLNLMQTLNREKLQRDSFQPQVEGVIEAYELAFRMQDAMPAVMDTSKETAATLAMYGVNQEETASFGRQCLLARRMVESGVRFVEVTLGPWDQHTNLKADHKARAEACDKPIAALLQDLKQRDMLKDTLVIWGGEFGRSPEAQGSAGDGRNHNNKGYTTWMAGGGVKGGFSYGATDEYGYETVENKCHIHDWHATILHLLGLDHERLTYRYAGRDYRLTDVHGVVAKDILA